MRFCKPFMLIALALFTNVYAETKLELAKVVGGLNKPLAMAQAKGDSRLFVLEQEGLIKVLEKGAITDVILDLTQRIVPLNKDYDERGLLGLAFHPNFMQNRKFYVAFSVPIDKDSLKTYPNYSHINVIEEFNREALGIEIDFWLPSQRVI